MLILGRDDVLAVLDGPDAEDAVCRTVRDTYIAHANHETSVPHSVFLRFPQDSGNRIIALPAYVGGSRPVAAVKWIASFPQNIERGLARASATIVLNSVDDGRPVALLEGAVISARRTAASAAVAAAELTAGAPHEVRTGVSLIGCGVINGEVLRFLRTQLPELAHVSVFDLDPRRARAFADRIRQGGPPLRVEVVETVEQAIAANRLVSLATTATRPHLDLQDCRPGTVLLHLSLRDLTPASVLSARNVVDDAEHVCRAETSLDLAERAVGDRRFITAEIGNVLAGRTQVAWDPASVTVFSPFGLGALDAALAAYVHDVAAARGFGIHITDFVPAEGRSAPY